MAPPGLAQLARLAHGQAFLLCDATLPRSWPAPPDAIGSLLSLLALGSAFAIGPRGLVWVALPLMCSSEFLLVRGRQS